MNPASYYFIIRPAFLWFGFLVPGVLLGFPAVRARWFLLGCFLWAGAFVSTEELLPLVRFPGEARARFASLRGEGAGTDSSPAREARAVPLRIVSWNVYGGVFGPDEAVSQLAEEDPDIVLFQEYGQLLTEAVRRSASFRGYSLDVGLDGAILSRFPVSRPPEAKELRPIGEAWAVALPGDAQLACISVHLRPHNLITSFRQGWGWRAAGTDIALSRRQFQDLGRMVRRSQERGPVILAGDLNLPASYPDLRLATPGLKDCFSTNGFGWGKTVTQDYPLLRIDAVFVPKDAQVYYCATLPTAYSDHRPVLAEVLLIVPEKAGGVSR